MVEVEGIGEMQDDGADGLVECSKDSAFVVDEEALKGVN